MQQRHLYPMGIIGNCAFMAHIDTRGNIVWMCWPRFDSSFIFGPLLDKEKGGCFSLSPSEFVHSRQYYGENTNILCTEIACADGTFRITDYAPRFLQYDRYFKPLMLIRKIEPLTGNPQIKIACHPVTGYGATPLQPVQASNHIDYTGGESNVRLTTNFPVNSIMEDSACTLNETKYLVLTYGSPLEAPLEATCESFLQQTKQYWQHWVKNTSIGNMYRTNVIRSALALKIHQYEDTGAMIASGTTSLPEYPGSGRTWDYRYCWLRDAYYILQAFHNIGHFEEMEHYFNFIANVSVKEQGRYQPLYGITGKKDLPERIIPLAGYMGNLPVRIGNQASEHIQNDVYGQVLLSLLPLYTDERFTEKGRSDSAGWIASLLGKIEMVIDEKDAGLWEYRNLSFQHCYTSLFHWAGCHAAKKIAERIHNRKLAEWAEKLIRKAEVNIEACYNPVKKVYQHAVNSSFIDVSTLQLIIMGYLDPASLKARQHLIAVEKVLSAPNGLFYRYKHDDDFGYPQSTFLIAAFWHVEALACVGRLKEAVERLESLLGFSNHLGLMSEDVSPEDGSQWGNFPQAYSHVGLMNAVYRISKKTDRPNFL